MESVAYGLFPSRAAADAAIEQLTKGGLPEDVVDVSEFVDDLPDEDLPGPATRSRPNALIGGVLAAILGGVLGGLLLGNKVVGVSPFVVGAIAALGSGLLGALLGTITGYTIPRRELGALTDEVEDGKVLVTVSTHHERTSEDIIAELEEYGAVRTGLLSGLGLGPTQEGAVRGPST